MKKRKRKLRIIVHENQGMQPWRWSKLYFSPGENIVVTARLYLIDTSPTHMLYELRYLPEGATIESVIRRMKITTMDSAYSIASRVAKKHNLISAFDPTAKGHKSNWDQENYDPASVPEPIEPPAPPKKEQMVREAKVLSKKKLLSRIRDRARKLAHLHKTTRGVVGFPLAHANEIVEWSKGQDRDTLAAFWDQFSRHETFD